MSTVVLNEPEPRDEPAGFLAWIANTAGGDAYTFRVRMATLTSLGVIVWRAAVEKENLAKLAKVTIARGTADNEFDFLTNETEPAIEICTADELVRLCYWMRDTRTPIPCKPPDDDSDLLGYADLDAAYLFGLGYTQWFVREVRVIGRGHIEYARWTADELAAAVAEMRATARRPPVDPAEPPGGDGEI